jgi:uncharacterized secreted protein with C-terminal beta-propeller domain
MKARQFILPAFAIFLATMTASAAAADRRSIDVSPRIPDRRVRPIPASSRSIALQALDNCGQAHEYLIEVAVERVLEYRYNRWYILPWSGAGGDREAADVPSDYTTTNNQEQGVDELDIVKTNGTHLYATEGNTLHIMRSWPAEGTAELATAAAGNSAQGLFLRGNRVLVASQTWNSDDGVFHNTGGTRLELYDVADPFDPRVLRTVDIEGWLVDARLIDGDLYAVVRSQIELPGKLWDLAQRDDLGLPDLPWDASDAERERILAEARAILAPYVVELMAEIPIDDLLPQMRDRTPDNPEALIRPLLECSSLYRPAKASNWSVLSVIHLDLDEAGPVSAVGLLADGWTVYASAASLYVAQTSDWWWWGWGWTPPEMTTSIHLFELDPSLPAPIRYAASGEVDGWLLDQFALSEHEGHLRVATTEFDWWWGTTDDEEPASSVTVLADDGRGNLQKVGHVGGLGPGEQIFAVRFMGTKGYIVTFEQVDPLYTLDLSDPTRPEVVGELKVTGFSSYLHPVGDDWLLAVGMEADEEGRILGLAVSVFDVRDFANPTLAHRYLIESGNDTWSWSEALADHHAFTYHRGVLSIPAYIGGAEGRFSGLLVLAVDPEEGIHELGRVDHQGLGSGAYDPWMRRSVYIEDALYSLSSAGVKVNHLYNPDIELAKVVFGE